MSEAVEQGTDRPEAAAMIGPEAMRAAAAYLAREWGEDGYRIGMVGAFSRRVGLFEAAHSDGSRWYITADIYGNVGHGDTIAEAVEAIR